MSFLPYIPFANCAEVVLQGVQDSAAAYLTFGVQKSGAFSGSDLSDIADIFDTWYGSNLQPYMSVDIAFNEIKVTDLTTSSSPVVQKNVTAPQQGAVTSDAVPSQVALIVSFITGLRGRAYRGRNYVPGMPAAGLVAPGHWNTTQTAAIQGAYEQLPILLAAAGFFHVVLSRQVDGVRRTVGQPTPVAFYVAKEPVGTIRRRVPGRGI